GLYRGTPQTPGTYQFTIRYTETFGPPGAQEQAIINIISTHVILPIAGAVVLVEPGQLSLQTPEGGAAGGRSITLTNRGGQIAPFSVSATTVNGGLWLSVTPSNGAVAAFASTTIAVAVNSASLPAGSYRGSITVTVGPDRYPIPVLLTVTPNQPVLALSQTGLTFNAVAAGGAAPVQTFQVFNTGAGALNWNASGATLSGGASWLAISPASGTSTSTSSPQVTVTVNQQGLAPGDYYAQIQVSSQGVANSPQMVSVVLVVLAPADDPGPLVTPTGLVFVAVPGGTPAPPQMVSVSTLGAQPIDFQVSVSVDQGLPAWLSVQPSSASARPGQPARITVQANVTGLAPAIYRGVLTLRFDSGAQRKVDVLFVVPRVTGSPGAKVRAVDNCTPSRLELVFSLLGASFRVTAGWPVPIEAVIVDDCGNPMTSGSAAASFSNLDPALVLAPLRDGRWSATWTPRTAAAQVVVTVRAETTAPRLAGSAQLGGGLQPGTAVPIIGGTVSAASFARGVALSPGSLIAIFGTNLAETLATAQELPLSTDLAGARVLLGGRALPLVFASSGQINAMIPYDLPVNSTQQLIVRKGARVSVPEPLAVAAAQPAVFTTSQTGAGAGIVVGVKADGRQFLIDARNPVSAGDFLIIYCEGLGATNPAVPAGTAVPLTQRYPTVNPVAVTVGGRSAHVDFAGLTSGFTGLYQINAIVPEGVAAGDAVEVTITASGQTSTPVTIVVR
ncbi:MAG: BACON domain-containing protein, partial [Bryobacteraceae bacterium]